MSRYFLILVTVLTVAIMVACLGGREMLLTGTSWTLIAIDSQEALRDVSDVVITVEFAGEGNRMKGSSGCNSFHGEYAVDGSTFRTVDLGSTEAKCPSQELYDRETEFQQALFDARDWAFENSRLVIGTSDERKLIFAPY